MYTSKKELNENHRNEKSIQTKIKPTKSIKQKLGEWKKMCFYTNEIFTNQMYANKSYTNNKHRDVQFVYRNVQFANTECTNEK